MTKVFAFVFCCSISVAYFCSSSAVNISVCATSFSPRWLYRTMGLLHRPHELQSSNLISGWIVNTLKWPFIVIRISLTANNVTFHALRGYEFVQIVRNVNQWHQWIFGTNNKTSLVPLMSFGQPQSTRKFIRAGCQPDSVIKLSEKYDVPGSATCLLVGKTCDGGSKISSNLDKSFE